MVDIKQKILLLEDDANLGIVIQENLEMRGYEVQLAPNGDEGKRHYDRSTFDLCLVDVMMPKKDGFAFAREIREHDHATPIIFLTARAMKEDKIAGFRIGADDYVTKPFSMEELILRIQAVLRRSSGVSADQPQQTKFTIGEYFFDVKTQTLVINGKPKKLTSKESDLLRMLCMHIDRELSRETALKKIWGSDSYFSGRSMDVYISKLRRYLRHDKRIQIITLHGKGFRLIVQ